MDPGVVPSGSFRKQVEEATGQSIGRCYQCKKCSGGCSVHFAMDMKTHQVIRAVLLGQKDELLAANSFWVCSGCKICKQRCPNQIDSGAVMDYLRQLNAKEKTGLVAEHSDVPAFHDSFLGSVRNNGRVYELGMIAAYKNKTKSFARDMQLGIDMFLRGKLALLPSRIRNLDQIRAIFRKAKEKRP